MAPLADDADAGASGGKRRGRVRPEVVHAPGVRGARLGAGRIEDVDHGGRLVDRGERRPVVLREEPRATAGDSGEDLQRMGREVPGDGPQTTEAGRTASEVYEQPFEAGEDVVRRRPEDLANDAIESRRLNERLVAWEAILARSAVGEL